MQSGPPGRARGLAATGGGERGAGDTWWPKSSHSFWTRRWKPSRERNEPSSRSCAIAVTCAVRFQPSEQWTRTEERPMCTWRVTVTAARSTPRTCSIHLQGGLAWAIGSAAIGFGSSPWLTDPDFSSSPSQPCSSRSSRPWAKAWCGDRGFISARNALSDARIAWMFSMPMKAICVFG